METANINTHILELSKEILDDIELSRIDSERLILKATRLARLIGSEEIRQWLRFELHGYNSKNDISIKYMSKTGRWKNKEELDGNWQPLAQIESIKIAMKTKLENFRFPELAGDKANVVTKWILQDITSAESNFSKSSSIISRVTGLIHNFAAQCYYEKLFSGHAETIFENYKENIDRLLADKCGDVLEKIPHIFDRLSNNDKEAISHALTTCRRIIDNFADAISPPTDKTTEINGNTLSLKKDKVQNRINAYIAQKIDSNSRKKKLRQTLSNLYERVSTGVHSDVDPNEAKSLFLETYLFLGEVISLN
jgi:hypothetical protein